MIFLVLNAELKCTDSFLLVGIRGTNFKVCPQQPPIRYLKITLKGYGA